MSLASQDDQPLPHDKKKEWRLFIFIIVFLFPILSVAVVGGYGFAIWMYQLLMGPPGAG
jgi:nitrate reductase NapE